MFTVLLPTLLDRFTAKYPHAPAEVIRDIIQQSLEAADRSRAGRRASRAEVAERNERIVTMISHGLTLGAIAAELKMSRPHVSQVIAKLRTDGVDIPAFYRGRPPTHAQALPNLLPYYAQGFDDDTIARKLHMDAQDIAKGRLVAKAKGIRVPTSEEAELWYFTYTNAVRVCRGIAKALTLPVWPEHHYGEKEETLRARDARRADFYRQLEIAPSLGITNPPKETIE